MTLMGSKVAVSGSLAHRMTMLLWNFPSSLEWHSRALPCVPTHLCHHSLYRLCPAFRSPRHTHTPLGAASCGFSSQGLHPPLFTCSCLSWLSAFQACPGLFGCHCISSILLKGLLVAELPCCPPCTEAWVQEPRHLHLSTLSSRSAAGE